MECRRHDLLAADPLIAFLLSDHPGARMAVHTPSYFLTWRRGFMAFLHDMRFRAYFYQIVAIGFVALVGWTMFSTASGNLAKQNIATGFDFLTRPAGFVITKSAIAFEQTDTVGRAILVGIANTVKVSLLAAISARCLASGGHCAAVAQSAAGAARARLCRAFCATCRCCSISSCGIR
ncbi:MAG: hypothetical protein QM784_19205 [Polyangiaceae bacterium]